MSSLNSLASLRTLKERLGVCVYKGWDYSTDEWTRLTDAFGWIRRDLSWASTETAEGVYDFSAHDTAINQALDAGLGVLLVLAYVNGDVYPDLFQDVNGYKNNYVGPASDEARAKYVDWVRAVATHFDGKRVGFEIYNEPQNRSFWGPYPNPAGYALLAVLATDAIKSVDPGALVFTGGGLGLPNLVNISDYSPQAAGLDYTRLEGTGEENTWSYCKTFNKTALEAGCAVGADAVSVHLYNQTFPPEFLMDEGLAWIRDYTRVPIIDTEWGVNYNGYHPRGYGRYIGDRRWVDHIPGYQHAARMTIRKILYELGTQGLPLSILFSWRGIEHDPYIYGDLYARRPWSGEVGSTYQASAIAGGCGLNVYDPDDDTWGGTKAPSALEGYYLEGFDVIRPGSGYAKPIVGSLGLKGCGGALQIAVRNRQAVWGKITDPGHDYTSSGDVSITDHYASKVTEPTKFGLYSTTIGHYNEEPVSGGALRGGLMCTNQNLTVTNELTGPDVVCDGPTGYTTAATVSADQRMNVGGWDYYHAYPRPVNNIVVQKARSTGRNNALLGRSRTNTGLSWAAGTVTVLCANHLLSTGNEVQISGVTPGGYNGTYTVVSAVPLTSFTYALVADPGGVSTVHGTSRKRGGIDADDTVVEGTFTSFLPSGKVVVDGEHITYSGKGADGYTLTGLTRAQDSSLAMAHADSASIYEVPTTNLNLTGTPIDNTSIVEAGGTATVTTDDPHGLVTTDWVKIIGAIPLEYNGMWQVTVIDPTTYTFVVGMTLAVALTTGTSTKKNGTPLTNAALTIPVVSTVGFPNIGVAKLESEYVLYTAKTATALTIQKRGACGTTAATHADWTVVEPINLIYPSDQEIQSYGYVSDPAVAVYPDIITACGQGHAVNDVLTMGKSLNGTGTGLKLKVSAVYTQGLIQAVSINTGDEGTGYVVGEFVVQTASTGSGIDCYARVMGIDDTGAVTSVRREWGGLYFSDKLPIVTQFGSTPIQAEGQTAGGSITDDVTAFFTPLFYKVDSQGTGYTTRPLLSITPDPTDLGLRMGGGRLPSGGHYMANLGAEGGVNEGKVIFLQCTASESNNGLYYSKKPVVSLLSGKDSFLGHAVTLDGEVIDVMVKGPGCAVTDPSLYSFRLKGGQPRAIFRITANGTPPTIEVYTAEGGPFPGQNYTQNADVTFLKIGNAVSATIASQATAGEKWDRTIERLADERYALNGNLDDAYISQWPGVTVNSSGGITSWDATQVVRHSHYAGAVDDLLVANKPGRTATINPIWKARPVPKSPTGLYSAVRSLVDLLGDCEFVEELGSACTIHQRWRDHGTGREYRVIWSKAPEPCTLVPVPGTHVTGLTITNEGNYSAAPSTQVLLSGTGDSSFTWGTRAIAYLYLDTLLYMASNAPSSAGAAYTDGTDYEATLTGGGGTGGVILFNVVGNAVTNVRIHEKGTGWTGLPTVAFNNCPKHDGSAGNSGAGGPQATLVGPELAINYRVASAVMKQRGCYADGASITAPITGGTAVTPAVLTPVTVRGILRTRVDDPGTYYPPNASLAITVSGGTTDAHGVGMTFDTCGVQAIHMTDYGVFTALQTPVVTEVWTDVDGNTLDFSSPAVVLEDDVTVIQAWDWQGVPMVVGTSIIPTGDPIIVEVSTRHG